MHRRLNALRTAAIIAAGFVVLRVGYRVVFGGGSGDGLMIADPPRIRLDGPFAHVVLFGPITTGGIAAAAVSALPFAGMVFALGLIGVVVDLRALLTRGAIRGPVRTVSRALVVAWGAFPGLVESVRRVRVAQELRGERSAASLIVPVLEQTVERAIALGASMEVRGFAATRPVEPVCERPVRMRDAALGFETRWTLTGIDLDLEPGTLTLISGPTGAGKSTLLHALSGVFQHVSQGVQGGLIEVAGVDRLAVPPRETAGFVGVVAQSVRLSFVAATVAEEVGFALAMRGVAPVIVEARVGEIAERLNITHLLEREVVALSAGEACLVAIGAAIVAHPVLLLVDEPLAELDTDARERVVAVLDELAHSAGVCVVVAEHAVAEVLPIADRRVVLAHGTAGSGTAASGTAVSGPAVSQPAAPSPTSPASLSSASRRFASPSSDPVVVVRDLTVHHGRSRAVESASLDLGARQIVALMGPNGAGKSSLLHALARPPRAGVVEVAGRDVLGLGRRARRAAVALVPEAFDDLLFETTVRRELTRADRRATRSAPSSAERFTRLLGFDRVDDAAELLDTHPRDLSAGERLCLVLAIQLAAQPTLLLVDEPSRGLDDVARRLVGEALSSAAADGAAVMFATHDREFAERYAARTLAMSDARVREGAVR